jgi:hypothetical protein
MVGAVRFGCRGGFDVVQETAGTGGGGRGGGGYDGVLDIMDIASSGVAEDVFAKC